jgi:hypothetical protein
MGSIGYMGVLIDRSERGSHSQLEYLPQAMLSLRDVAYGGVLYTFSNRSVPEPGQVV